MADGSRKNTDRYFKLIIIYRWQMALKIPNGIFKLIIIYRWQMAVYQRKN